MVTKPYMKYAPKTNLHWTRQSGTCIPKFTPVRTEVFEKSSGKEKPWVVFAKFLIYVVTMATLYGGC